MTLAQIDLHAEALDKFDVEGVLAFAERVLPRASNMWTQASLEQRQRLQALFFPQGIAFDGKRFNRTAVTGQIFKYLPTGGHRNESLVSRIFASWNQLDGWLRQLQRLRSAA
jgi:hypothetical protein